MTKIGTLIKEYNIEGNLPKKFGELDVFNKSDIEEYHTETHDGNEVHVFTYELENGNKAEYILDLKNNMLTRIVTNNGEQVFGPYEEYEYVKEVDDIKITRS